ncbi:adenosine deaminase [Streptomyces sp. NPDC088350]|uniref:adenosine deaminase family protein n=1 Tax=Streptomyces sp. NPDC088350 TaxID=3365854 RepID=UPI0038166484
MNGPGKPHAFEAADMDVRELSQALPKVDVHCHLTGSIPLDTAVELARRNKLGIGRSVIETAYDLRQHSGEAREQAFFDAFELLGTLVRTPRDLNDAVYGLVAHDVRASNLRYLELFVNPTALARTGMSFTAIQDGLIDGARAAEADFGVRTNFIACVLRDEPASYAEEMLDQLIAHRREEFIGIGLDGPEFLDEHRPIHFADVFRRARSNGFRRTAHYVRYGAAEYSVYTDLLACDRIDHGYPVTEDEAVLRRAAESAVPFTVCPTITQLVAGDALPEYSRPETHPIGTMLRGGVWIVPGTDDKSMVHTDIGTEYGIIADWYGLSAGDVVQASLDGISATWLDESDKDVLRREFQIEINRLTSRAAEIAPAGTAQQNPS